MAVGHASDMTPSSSNYNFFLILYRLLTQPAWFLFLQSCFSLMYVCVCVCVCVCVYVLSLDNSPPGSSVHGIFQARILEWVVISYSRRSSLPRHQAHISCVSSISRQIFFFYRCDTWTLDLSDLVVLKMSVQWNRLKGTKNCESVSLHLTVLIQ